MASPDTSLCKAEFEMTPVPKTKERQSGISHPREQAPILRIEKPADRVRRKSKRVHAGTARADDLAAGS